jgi:hypothetical protein
VPYCYC